MELTEHREPWNKGKLVGQKPPLKPKDIWAMRIILFDDIRVTPATGRSTRREFFRSRGPRPAAHASTEKATPAAPPPP